MIAPPPAAPIGGSRHVVIAKVDFAVGDYEWIAACANGALSIESGSLELTVDMSEDDWVPQAKSLVDALAAWSTTDGRAREATVERVLFRVGEDEWIATLSGKTLSVEYGSLKTSIDIAIKDWVPTATSLVRAMVAWIHDENGGDS